MYYIPGMLLNTRSITGASKHFIYSVENTPALQINLG